MLWASLFFVVLVLAGVVLVVRALFDDRGDGREAASSALSVLEERYARGDIDRHEFEDRRDVLLGRTDTRST
jgi:putative membrane protein